MQSDQPIERSANDLFDRKNFAKRIAEVVLNRGDQDSLVVGIHSPWGEGKTSVLFMIEEFLKDYLRKNNRTLLNGDVVLYKFNPWRYGDEDTLLRSYFLGLADAVDGRIVTQSEKLADLVRRYSWAAAPLDLLKVTFAPGVEASGNFQETLKKLAEAKPEATVDDLKGRIEDILRNSQKRIVVFMDDIDRLDKTEVQAVFRLVKLTSNFPNTAFVLAFDPIRVAEALKEQYGGNESSKLFVEKIIQLPLPLPPLSTDKLINVAFDHINKLLEDNEIEVPAKDAGDWVYFFRSHFGKYLKSPRQINRYINNLYFFVAGMKGEISIPDLLSIEAIHTFFPSLYDLIRRRKDLFLLEATRLTSFADTEQDLLKKELLSEIARFPEAEQGDIGRILVRLFPRTEAVFGNSHYGTDWYDVWAKEKKIAAPNYFDRYFQYGITDTDISDTALTDFLATLDKANETYLADKMRGLISNDRENLFLYKLSILENPTKISEIRALAICIAISKSFPVWEGNFLAQSRSPGGNAVRYLRTLIERIVDEGIRAELAVDIASRAEGLDFAVAFSRIAQYIGKEYGSSLEGQEASGLAKSVFAKVAERIAEFAEQSDLDQEFPDESQRMYSLWHHVDPSAPVAYIKAKVDDDPTFAERFIRLRRKQNWEVASMAKVWGYRFIVDSIEKTNPNLDVPVLERVTEDGSFFTDTEEQYLAHFIAIAKKLHPDYLSEERS